MADPDKLHNPILVAAWPGMGSVALNAGGYLVEHLGAKLVAELPAEELFEVQQIEIEGGLVKEARQPRSVFFEWRDPEARRDLLIFLGEAQPAHGGFHLCRRILEYAARRGVRRLVTFAAMASQLHPSTPPRVFAVATQNDELVELRRQEVEILKDGEISGLNGVLLAAGAEQGLAGICLLGEMPFFAAGLPNPRASQAVLEVFCAMFDVELDMTGLQEQSEQAERALIQLLEQLQTAARQRAEAEEEQDDELDAQETEESSPEPAVDESTRRRIEVLFEQAQRDRTRALELKELLDRHGVFDRYEDRFLDLFRKAE